MTNYFLGIDVGGTKTHALITDEAGRALGFGEAGPGNHESVGYNGLRGAMLGSMQRALECAHLKEDQIAGAGFGVAGYDWPSERKPTLEVVYSLGLSCPVDAVNDTMIGLLAGSPEGWGVGVVAGTGCNCRGWDKTRKREGMVTGSGEFMGEAGGSIELIGNAVKAVAYEWAQRGPATLLTPMLVQRAGVGSPAELLERLIDGRFPLDAADAPLVFQAAEQGDAVALGLIRWIGHELGELANCVIRQLDFAGLTFDVVQVGSMHDGSPLLTQSMRRTVHRLAPGARFIRLKAPPVVGAVLLGMEQVGMSPDLKVRQTLADSVALVRAGKPNSQVF